MSAGKVGHTVRYGTVRYCTRKTFFIQQYYFEDVTVLEYCMSRETVKVGIIAGKSYSGETFVSIFEITIEYKKQV